MFSKIYTVNHIGDSDIQAQSIEELKQQKNYLKLLKKQGKELKELRKKHLKKVHTPTEWKHTFHQCRNITSFACMPQNKWVFFFACIYLQVWNLSKEQKSRSSQIKSDTQRRRSQMEKNLKRSIKKK